MNYVVIAFVALLVVVPAGLAAFFFLVRHRCENCKRFFGLRHSARERIPGTVRWFEQHVWAAKTGQWRDFSPRSDASNPRVVTAVWEYVAEWSRCRHCGDVTYVMAPRMIRREQHGGWDAAKRAEQLESEGVSTVRSSRRHVEVCLEEMKQEWVGEEPQDDLSPSG
jgi:hypothetical protein